MTEVETSSTDDAPTGVPLVEVENLRTTFSTGRGPLARRGRGVVLTRPW